MQAQWMVAPASPSRTLTRWSSGRRRLIKRGWANSGSRRPKLASDQVRRLSLAAVLRAVLVQQKWASDGEGMLELKSTARAALDCFACTVKQVETNEAIKRTATNNTHGATWSSRRPSEKWSAVAYAGFACCCCEAIRPPSTPMRVCCSQGRHHRAGLCAQRVCHAHVIRPASRVHTHVLGGRAYRRAAHGVAHCLGLPCPGPGPSAHHGQRQLGSHVLAGTCARTECSRRVVTVMRRVVL